MKHLVTIILLAFSSLSFSQNTGMLIGKIMDNELQNSPLVMAQVTIKETATQTNTDLTGMFVIENLKAGDYTLVCGFAGYETQEINVHVDALEPAEVKVSLAASTVTFGDLALLSSTAKQDETPFIAAN